MRSEKRRRRREHPDLPLKGRVRRSSGRQCRQLEPTEHIGGFEEDEHVEQGPALRAKLKGQEAEQIGG
jgi:hypothetical protein